jgi:hypothetical protein
MSIVEELGVAYENCLLYRGPHVFLRMRREAKLREGKACVNQSGIQTERYLRYGERLLIFNGLLSDA